MLRTTLLLLMPFLFLIESKAQFGYGLTGSLDVYQRYVNPKASQEDGSRSAGSVLLNLGLGPKIWVGNKKMSFSIEGQAVAGFFALSTSDKKGLGSLAIPVLAKLNFGGLSTFDREGIQGWSIGGGIQYNRTELYGLSDTAKANGVVRNYFKTYVIQVSYGFGVSGFTGQGFVRGGFHPEDHSTSLNTGIQFDLNYPMLKKIKNADSEL